MADPIGSSFDSLISGAITNSGISIEQLGPLLDTVYGAINTAIAPIYNDILSTIQPQVDAQYNSVIAQGVQDIKDRVNAQGMGNSGVADTEINKYLTDMSTQKAGTAAQMADQVLTSKLSTVSGSVGQAISLAEQGITAQTMAPLLNRYMTMEEKTADAQAAALKAQSDLALQTQNWTQEIYPGQLALAQKTEQDTTDYNNAVLAEKTAMDNPELTAKERLAAITRTDNLTAAQIRASDANIDLNAKNAAMSRAVQAGNIQEQAALLPGLVAAQNAANANTISGTNIAQRVQAQNEVEQTYQHTMSDKTLTDSEKQQTFLNQFNVTAQTQANILAKATLALQGQQQSATNSLSAAQLTEQAREATNSYNIQKGQLDAQITEAQATQDELNRQGASSREIAAAAQNLASLTTQATTLRDNYLASVSGITALGGVANTATANAITAANNTATAANNAAQIAATTLTTEQTNLINQAIQAAHDDVARSGNTQNYNVAMAQIQQEYNQMLNTNATTARNNALTTSANAAATGQASDNSITNLLNNNIGFSAISPYADESKSVATTTTAKTPTATTTAPAITAAQLSSLLQGNSAPLTASNFASLFGNTGATTSGIWS
jgi:hypothetical protein